MAHHSLQTRGPFWMDWSSRVIRWNCWTFSRLFIAVGCGNCLLLYIANRLYGSQEQGEFLWCFKRQEKGCNLNFMWWKLIAFFRWSWQTFECKLSVLIECKFVLISIVFLQSVDFSCFSNNFFLLLDQLNYRNSTLKKNSSPFYYLTSKQDNFLPFSTFYDVIFSIRLNKLFSSFSLPQGWALWGSEAGKIRLNYTIWSRLEAKVE